MRNGLRLGLREIVMGLRWHPRKAGLGASRQPANLDAQCVMFDKEHRVIEVVHPGHLRNTNGSVLHTGDSTGVLRQVYFGALLHDVGKIGIPDAILGKHGPLSEAEWRVMRTHPDIGHRILAGVAALGPAAEIVLAHEERFDGSGYPHGLAGQAIPLWARLFALIDALDAMTSDRPYRKALAFETASAEIVRQAGAQFDPLVVEAFLGEQATLRGMVTIQCGEVDLPAAGASAARAV